MYVFVKMMNIHPPFSFFRIRLISLASQKFISDIANDALQYCKMKGTASGSSRSKTKVGISHVLDFRCKSNNYVLLRYYENLFFLSSKQDKKYTLTMEDLTPALTEYGINVKKPYYFT